MNTSTEQWAEEQQTLWNGSSGRAWIAAQQTLDDLFRPFEKLMVEAAAARIPRYSTLAAAQAVRRSPFRVGLVLTAAVSVSISRSRC